MTVVELLSLMHVSCKYHVMFITSIVVNQNYDESYEHEIHGHGSKRMKMTSMRNCHFVHENHESHKCAKYDMLVFPSLHVHSVHLNYHCFHSMFIDSTFINYRVQVLIWSVHVNAPHSF